MEILFITHDMYVGGAAKQLSLTAAGLLKRGHKVSLYTYVGDSLEHKINKGIRYIPELHPPQSRLKNLIQTPIHIHDLVRRERPDVVISWGTDAGGLTVLGCVGLPVKVVFSERLDPYNEKTINLRLMKFLCGFSDGGVFQTSMVREYYSRIKNSIVCPNPIDPNLNIKEITPIKDRKCEISWVGRMINVHKRMDVAVRAFELIHRKFPEYKLCFYGDGADLLSTKQLVSELGLNNSVIFHGTVKNVIDIVSKSRISLMTSDFEGIPNVIIESFAAGTPVVATDCSPGGARVLIKDSHNGFIVPIGDYSFMAQRVMELLTNDKLSEEFISRSQNKLLELNYNSILDSWNAFVLGMVKN